MKNGILNWILGITGIAAAVGFFFKTYGSKILKVLRISRHIIDLLDDLREALEPEADGKTVLTTEEIKTLQTRIDALKADLK